MPITTMFVRQSPDPWRLFSSVAKRCCAIITSATISSAVSDRTSPLLPLAQNAHPIAQPTWLEMHCVRRPCAGMTTVSTELPSASPSSSFVVPSSARSVASTFGTTIGNSFLSVSRKSFGSVVAASQS